MRVWIVIDYQSWDENKIRGIFRTEADAELRAEEESDTAVVVEDWME